MNYLHWRYFLSLERDFIATIDYVDLAPANSATFSNEFAKLLLLCGSEIDVVAKLLCEQASAAEDAKNIMDYRSILTTAFPGIHTVEVGAPRYQRTLRPWHEWGITPATSPSWWKAYNEVKHQRDQKFGSANQENALGALAGLLALLLYYYRDEDHLQPYPTLLDAGFPKILVTEGGLTLPGVA